MRCYIDIHVLQTVPPSNLNRDDAGSPKQAIYGGARRARVSSQAWKRATRTAFADHIDPRQLGTRTKKIASMLTDRIAARGNLDNQVSARIATNVLAELDVKPGKKETETAYLLFFGLPQLERLVDHIADDLPAWAALDDTALREAAKATPVRKLLGTGHPIDVALFGRMVAEIPTLNIDAATQVAHALSTHAVDTEFDYYTAVDDENTDGETGAGMIGTVEFHSATLYRFATVGLHQLVENLDGDPDAAIAALRVFLTAFAMSMPTGHENSFGHRTPPNLVTVAVRGDQPVNLVSAFESPVRANGDGVLGISIRRLAEEMTTATTLWGLRPATVASTYRIPAGSGADKLLTEEALAACLGEPLPFEQVVDTAVTAAQARFAAVTR